MRMNFIELPIRPCQLPCRTIAKNPTSVILEAPGALQFIYCSLRRWHCSASVAASSATNAGALRRMSSAEPRAVTSLHLPAGPPGGVDQISVANVAASGAPQESGNGNRSAFFAAHPR